MSILQRLILFSSTLILAGNSYQVYSQDKREIDIKPNILISNSIEGKKIKIITANGFGTTLESAAQNAAENALTKVVGSFIDAETQIKKQKEIRDGVLSKTKILKKNIREYSQGSIKYFEILNVEQNGAIFNVTARVDVRVDDFRAYIKKLGLQKKEISTTNLFAEMGTKKKNLENKFELLKKIITPIYEGEVIDIEIGELSTLDSFINSENCLLNLERSFCDPTSSRFHKYLNVENSVYVPFVLKLKKDFYKNAINTLDNISDLKTNSITSISGEDAFNNIGKNNNSSYNFYKSQDVGVILRNHENRTNSHYYILKDIGNRTVPSGTLSKLNKKYIRNIDENSSKLRISLLDINGEILYSFKERCHWNTVAHFHGELKSTLLIKKALTYNPGSYIGRINEECPSQLYSTKRDGWGNYNYIKFDITSQKYYGFAFEVDNLDKLKEFKAIEIEFVQK